MIELTTTQQAIVSFIEAFIDDNEHAPTIRQIGDVFDWSPNGVRKHLLKLRELGVVDWQDYKGRTLKVIK